MTMTRNLDDTSISPFAGSARLARLKTSVTLSSERLHSARKPGGSLTDARRIWYILRQYPDSRERSSHDGTHRKHERQYPLVVAALEPPPRAYFSAVEVGEPPSRPFLYPAIRDTKGPRQAAPIFLEVS